MTIKEAWKSYCDFCNNTGYDIWNWFINLTIVEGIGVMLLICFIVWSLKPGKNFPDYSDYVEE